MSDWIEKITGANEAETARLRKHIAFARNYVAEFGHGAPGHIDWVVITKLAELLDDAEASPHY